MNSTVSGKILRKANTIDEFFDVKNCTLDLRLFHSTTIIRHVETEAASLILVAWLSYRQGGGLRAVAKRLSRDRTSIIESLTVIRIGFRDALVDCKFSN